MILSFIGMSGSGKSYWSRKLEEKGFKRFGCDDLIEEKLQGELKKIGYRGINDMARWMGQPYEDRYIESSKKYLDFEKEVMHEVLKEVEKVGKQEDIIIDTTGSIIYTCDEILRRLQNLSSVIYLRVPQNAIRQLYRQYFADPKPVIWGNSFVPYKDESDESALRRCYVLLLKYREQAYEQFAHHAIDSTVLRRPDFSSDKLFKIIHTYD